MIKLVCWNQGYENIKLDKKMSLCLNKNVVKTDKTLLMPLIYIHLLNSLTSSSFSLS